MQRMQPDAPNTNSRGRAQKAVKFIKQLQECGFSLTDIERRTGIGCSSMNRWRKGEVEPHDYQLAKLKQLKIARNRSPGTPFCTTLVIRIDLSALDRKIGQKIRNAKRMLSRIEQLCP